MRVPNPVHGYVTVFAPAGATRYRVQDADLAETLAATGADVSGGRADVEIGGPSFLRGTAAAALVHLSVAEPRAGLPRPVRGMLRLGGALLLHARAVRARRAARRVGYDTALLRRWNRGDEVFFAPGSEVAVREPATLLPLRGVLVAGRGGLESRTILQAALHDASGCWPAADTSRRARLGSSGVAIVSGPETILRAALGPSAPVLDAGWSAAVAASSALGGHPLATLLPRPLTRGATGPATWTVETRLPGTRCPSPVPTPVVERGVDLLVALHRRCPPWPEPRPSSPILDAGVIARACRGEVGSQVAVLGQALEVALATAPRTFAHGDFWAGNLLVEDHRLTGVVDWSAAGVARLPFLDLLHLRLSDRRESTGDPLGVAVVRELLPGARLLADDVLHGYGDRIGVELRHLPLDALVLAYWLQRLAQELVDPDGGPGHAPTRRWLRDNVRVVLGSDAATPFRLPIRSLGSVT